MDSWILYNGALIPKCAPHLNNFSELDVKKVLKGQKALFARWISDWDCPQKTEWWYCIKSGNVDLSQMTSKQRYEIRKGLKNSNVFLIKELDISLINEIFDCAKDAFSDYPPKYRPILVYNEFVEELQNLIKYGDLWGCRDIESGILSGYGYCTINEKVVNLKIIKTRPRFQKKNVNAVIPYSICCYYLNEKHNLYVCDGARNIYHETNYQDYLVRTLNFRYAYCRLNIVYTFWMKVVVTLLYPIRKLFALGVNFNFLAKISAVLKQEQIRRSFK